MDGLIVPEDVIEHPEGYAEGHWDYHRRCADVEMALTSARERVEEWDRTADPHGWWHERPDWIALHNEVIQLRRAVSTATCEKRTHREL